MVVPNILLELENAAKENFRLLFSFTFPYFLYCACPKGNVFSFSCLKKFLFKKSISYSFLFVYTLSDLRPSLTSRAHSAANFNLRVLHISSLSPEAEVEFVRAERGGSIQRMCREDRGG